MTEALAERDMIDRAEAELLKYPAVQCPLVHTFTPGLYMRQILMPAGTMLTSRVHKQTHPFIIVKGRISVISGNERTTYTAPHIGITEAGTRRVLFAHEDTVWITSHANPDGIEDPDEMVEFLTDDAQNPLLEGIDDPRLETWRSDYSESVCLSFTENKKLATV